MGVRSAADVAVAVVVAGGARDAAVAGRQLHHLVVDGGGAQDAVLVVEDEARHVGVVEDHALALRRGEAADARAPLDRGREALGQGVLALAELADDDGAALEGQDRLEDESGLRTGLTHVEEADALFADGEALGRIHGGPQGGGGGQVAPGEEVHDGYLQMFRGRTTSDDARRAKSSWVPKLATNTSSESEKTQTKKM